MNAQITSILRHTVYEPCSHAGPLVPMLPRGNAYQTTTIAIQSDRRNSFHFCTSECVREQILRDQFGSLCIPTQSVGTRYFGPRSHALRGNE